MKTYTIIAGVNGCGKSSLTGVLRTEINNLGKIIDVDKITASCGYNALDGGKHAIAIIDDCLEKEICFTQETSSDVSLQASILEIAVIALVNSNEVITDQCPLCSASALVLCTVPNG